MNPQRLTCTLHDGSPGKGSGIQDSVVSGFPDFEAPQKEANTWLPTTPIDPPPPKKKKNKKKEGQSRQKNGPQPMMKRPFYSTYLGGVQVRWRMKGSTVSNFWAPGSRFLSRGLGFRGVLGCFRGLGFWGVLGGFRGLGFRGFGG